MTDWSSLILGRREEPTLPALPYLADPAFVRSQIRYALREEHRLLLQGIVDALCREHFPGRPCPEVHHEP